jgi:hypothetical protein
MAGRRGGLRAGPSREPSTVQAALADGISAWPVNQEGGAGIRTREVLAPRASRSHDHGPVRLSSFTISSSGMPDARSTPYAHSWTRQGKGDWQLLQRNPSGHATGQWVRTARSATSMSERRSLTAFLPLPVPRRHPAGRSRCHARPGHFPRVSSRLPQSGHFRIGQAVGYCPHGRCTGVHLSMSYLGHVDMSR